MWVELNDIPNGLKDMPTRENLISDLQRVATIVDGPPTANDYREYGEHGVSAFYDEFESWTKAREAAKVDGEIEHRNKISRSTLCSDISRVAKKVEGIPTKNDYEIHGEYSISTVYRAFDSWPSAREAAGINGKPDPYNKLTREELLEELKRLRDELEQTPTRQSMERIGEFSGNAYSRKFGSWNKALYAAGLEPNKVHNKNRQIYECDWCGKNIKRLRSTVAGQNNIFCSRDCKHEWQADNVVGKNHHQYNRVTVECDWCGTQMEIKPYFTRNRENNFCNEECFGAWCSENRVGENHPRWKGGRVEQTCENCGENYLIRRAKADTSRFCSYRCMGDAWKEEMVGSDNPNWRRGTIPYYGPNWEEQRKARLEKDEFACVICGMDQKTHYEKYGQDLAMHHVTPRREFVTDGEFDAERANAISNLRTMCVEHHAAWEGVPVAPE